MKIDELKSLLLKAWCAETAKGKWTPDVPSLNQCCVTALVVQDMYGGNILRCDMTDEDSHYWNKLPDGTELDLTRDQFEHIEALSMRETAKIRYRSGILSRYPDTIRRYGLLLQRIATAMEENKKENNGKIKI